MDLDEHERWLKQQLRDLLRRYQEEAKPLVDRLVQIQSLRPPPPILFTKDELKSLYLPADSAA